MIVLKHLTREFDIEPYKLRKILRTKFGKHRRWQWQTNDDPELRKIKTYLKRYGETIGVSASAAQSTHSPSSTSVEASPANKMDAKKRKVAA